MRLLHLSLFHLVIGLAVLLLASLWLQSTSIHSSPSEGSAGVLGTIPRGWHKLVKSKTQAAVPPELRLL